MKLSEKSMLITLNISQWSARKKDANATKAIHTQYGADEKAGTYSKSLIAKEHLEEIKKAATEARTHHYKYTLPWLDTGARILPTAHFDKYTEGMRAHRQTFEAHVENFLASYPDYVEQARYVLNGLFSEADYPPLNAMFKKFKFNTEILPMPDSDDFRVQLQAEDLERIKRNTEERLQAATATATQDIKDRTLELVGRMAERLSDPKNVFRDSLVENLKELVDLLPGLNITGDPRIDQLRQDLGKLTEHGPEMLRNHKPARAKVATEANNILNKMSGYFG